MTITKKKVENALLRMGNTKKDTKKLLEKNYADVKRIYKGQGLTNKQAALIIRRR